MQLIELTVQGGSFETVISDWTDGRFQCKTFQLPAFTGWFSQEFLAPFLAKNKPAERCCNIHGLRLAVSNGKGLTPEQLEISRKKQQAHGRQFLLCPHPGCDVGVWSGANSLPADQQLRTLRSEVFKSLQKNTATILSTAREMGIVTDQKHYISVGYLNFWECLLLLGRPVIDDEFEDNFDASSMRPFVSRRLLDLGDDVIVEPERHHPTF